MIPPFDPLSAAEGLLARIGYPRASSASPLPGGRNNLVWVVESANRRFLLKRYFWSEQDPRDRMGQEWAFLHHLRQIGCLRAPCPLACDPETRCALMEFIGGNPIEIQNVTLQDVEAAADFFVEINRDRSLAASLQPVSEACFTLADHVAIVAARISRVRTIAATDDHHSKAQEFVRHTMDPLWRAIEDHFRSLDDQYLADVLPIEKRCLSPSDFGFHNVVRQNDGVLRFLDFEYAGWDDPAKTMIDFCNQPDGLLRENLAGKFREIVMKSFPQQDDISSRIGLLEPLYQLKWACICLNGFLPGLVFSDPRPDRSPEAQLARAATMADRASNT